ncbi:MAG TPA: hypothetical protein VN950_03520, partial [Terriglobales bacterium]|nr:hypothetical protein [Terriglobales bacterium]
MTTKSICKFAYASLLALSLLTFMPALASAQDARGAFTLTHDVRWQNVAVPAGDYKFSAELRGPSEMLVLRKVSGGGSGFMILVNDVDSIAPATAAASENGKLTLVSQSGTRYVSAMELPAIGTTLHFA